MSYEVVGEKVEKCPCGKGTVRLIMKSNDWNQFKDEITINCADCVHNFAISKEYCPRKPGHDYEVYFLKNLNNGKKVKLDF